jgi:uncharacterized protein (DUF1684 family)
MRPTDRTGLGRAGRAAIACSVRAAPHRQAAVPGGGYGGGRYLLDTVKGADLGGDGDHLVVDLNFAYAPSCAYDPAWACPLAPPGNRVDADVPVGELQP